MRDHPISVRLTADERTAIEEAAELVGMSPGVFIRVCALFGAGQYHSYSAGQVFRDMEEIELYLEWKRSKGV